AVNAKDVWDDDYVGVWHLGESAVPMKESSETSSDFTTAYGSTIEYAADGVVGGSVGFPAGGQYNSLAAPDHDALDGFSQFTLETWTYQTEHKHNAGVLAKRAGFAKETAYYLFGASTSTLSTMPLCVATNKNANVDWAYHQVQTLGAWNHLAYTVDMTKTTSNICGAKNGIMSTWKSSKDFHGTMANCASDLCLGNLYVNGKDNSFNGRIDEVRISKVVRSAEWIKATYETVMKPDFAHYEAQGATALSGYKAWMNANELVGAPDEKSANGIANGVRYAFDIAPEKGPDAVGDPIIQVVRDANGNPSVQSRDLATGRDDVTFGILATPDLTDWSSAKLVPMKKFATDGLWHPTASESSGYVFPSQMFFKYTIDIQE
ncbi:MAG: LamG domain-containing protein, partial [Kiritimatiellae bacterium]|nr:LamG domain-containing protein [Kiritimatiellia bacterium]